MARYLPAPVLPSYRGRQPGRCDPWLPACRPGSDPAWFPEPMRPRPRWCCSWSTVWAGSSCRNAFIWPRTWLSGRRADHLRGAHHDRDRVDVAHVGAAPAAHGIVGYRVVVDGPDRPRGAQRAALADPSGDARPFVDPRAFQPLPPLPGSTVPVVSKANSPAPASPRPITGRSRRRVVAASGLRGRGAGACRPGSRSSTPTTTASTRSPTSRLRGLLRRRAGRRGPAGRRPARRPARRGRAGRDR